MCVYNYMVLCDLFIDYYAARPFFIDRDPRREYALTEAKPFLSFFLYHAHSASAPLSVLRDPATVDQGMTR